MTHEEWMRCLPYMDWPVVCQIGIPEKNMPPYCLIPGYEGGVPGFKWPPLPVAPTNI